MIDASIFRSIVIEFRASRLVQKACVLIVVLVQCRLCTALWFSGWIIAIECKRAGCSSCVRSRLLEDQGLVQLNRTNTATRDRSL